MTAPGSQEQKRLIDEQNKKKKLPTLRWRKGLNFISIEGGHFFIKHHNGEQTVPNVQKEGNRIRIGCNIITREAAVEIAEMFYITEQDYA